MVYWSLFVWTPTAAAELSVSATSTGERMVINKDIILLFEVRSCYVIWHLWFLASITSS